MRETNFRLMAYGVASKTCTLEIYTRDVDSIIKYIKDPTTYMLEGYRDGIAHDIVITDNKQNIIGLTYELLQQGLLYTSLENVIELTKLKNIKGAK